MIMVNVIKNDRVPKVFCMRLQVRYWKNIFDLSTEAVVNIFTEEYG